MLILRPLQLVLEAPRSMFPWVLAMSFQVFLYAFERHLQRPRVLSAIFREKDGVAQFRDESSGLATPVLDVSAIKNCMGRLSSSSCNGSPGMGLGTRKRQQNCRGYFCSKRWDSPHVRMCQEGWEIAHHRFSEDTGDEFLEEGTWRFWWEEKEKIRYSYD